MPYTREWRLGPATDVSETDSEGTRVAIGRQTTSSVFGWSAALSTDARARRASSVADARARRASSVAQTSASAAASECASADISASDSVSSDSVDSSGGWGPVWRVASICASMDNAADEPTTATGCAAARSSGDDPAASGCAGLSAASMDHKPVGVENSQ
eukprot:TRINITY_DN31792_c0_g1_i1.p2 TRINITY_DN31792_c0_g1~~TRINITY_DN31792_c0_g1_i1.p2  ORF type:complete len:160 (+),score=16.13 TRINITY_DN31792_c0_g1_i1:918-1397(+)